MNIPGTLQGSSESDDNPKRRRLDPAATTVSTIAVQTGSTRVVIALLNVGATLDLKVVLIFLKIPISLWLISRNGSYFSQRLV